MQFELVEGVITVDEVDGALQALLFEDGTFHYPVPSAALDRTLVAWQTYGEAIVEQQRAGGPVPWDDALESLLARANDVRLVVVGTAALAVQGVDVAPCDVDVVTDAAGAHALDDRYGDRMLY
ncbi:MAG TPA: hypothetical protein VEA78_05855, partial [Acidimicrobiales bacterium]|nr:hypothetical protein [Acidimicrobiales bacterium]